MTSTASILNDFGIPWPDANTANAREAADAWTQLALAAEDAHSQAGSAARSLAVNNAGAAMDAFTTYWDSIDGTSKSAKLPLLIACCQELAKLCNEYADAVDEAKRKLEETAAEIAVAIAGGAIFTVITFGASDAVGDAAAAALVPTAIAADAALGDLITSLVSSLIGGAALGTLDAMFEELTTASVKAAFGEPQDSASDDVKDVEWAALLGGAGGLISKSASAAVTSGTSALGATYAEELEGLDSRLPGIVAAIPDALNTPAGKALLSLASASAANAIATKSTDPPSIQEILGEVLDSKIESAGDGATETETK